MRELLQHKYAPYVAFVLGILIVLIIHFINPKLISFTADDELPPAENSETVENSETTK